MTLALKVQLTLLIILIVITIFVKWYILICESKSLTPHLTRKGYCLARYLYSSCLGGIIGLSVAILLGLILGWL